MDFRYRSSDIELMDEGAGRFEEFHDCLRELEVINQLTLAYRPTLSWLKPWLQSGEKLAILDAGSGGGDMLRRIASKAGESSIELIGVDLNPWAKKSAELSAEVSGLNEQATQIRYATANIFSFEPAKPVDIVISSLFTHHLSDEQIVRFLRWIHTRARRGWFINDLHRHPLPYHFIKLATRGFSNNRLIRNDAAVSVARAFTKHDWQRLLDRAGLLNRDHVQLRWHFPFRLCVSCVK